MKFVLSVVWKAVLLYLAALAGFVLGMAVPALRVYRVLSQSAANVRTYDFDWLIAVLLVWAVLLLVALLRKRPREAATATVALLIVLAIVTLGTQLGLKDTPLQ